ncbi:MAG: IS3 family transposase [Candidatus Thermoplasmatota archaeon]|nr:IS3 family transposase [Candidatus Thermoplasmatota archaeon]
MLISRGFGVKKASVLSGVPKSTYYNWLLIKEMESRRYIPEKDVKKIVELCSIRTTYGYRRIWALLRRDGINHNPKTVLRIMKGYNLTLKKNVHKGRQKRETLYRARGPDELWEADITYIPTVEEGMIYLFNVKDCFTKKWVGYEYSRTCNRRDAIKSIENATKEYVGGKVTGIVLRTDNGTQYTSKMFKEGVKALGFKQEYIEKNTPEDNGDIESFHNSIKTDYIWTNEFRTYEEVNRAIKEAYRDYNEERPHSTIEYMSPNEFIERWNVDENFGERYLNSPYVVWIRKEKGG